MSDDLSKLPFALRLGRSTLANIRQNVTIALALKLAFVVLAAAGLATMWMAIVADTGASLLVTANSLRLLKAR
jgi:Cd2+/Zn2+-exporting ATPase